MQSFWQLDNDPQVMRSDFLNQVTHAADSWLSKPEWMGARVDPAPVLEPGEQITLGFDGAVRDDSTALVACRVSDGFLWPVQVWEKPALVSDWQVDRADVHRAVDEMFERYRVIGFYADPPYWQDAVDTWTQKYGHRLVVGIGGRPIEWWTNRPSAMVAALERFHSAVLDRTLAHGGDGEDVLTAHVLNARNREGRAGFTIAKEHPKSDRKIDAAMAAVLAYECRADAVAKGYGVTRRRKVKAAAF